MKDFIDRVEKNKMATVNFVNKKIKKGKKIYLIDFLNIVLPNLFFQSQK